jgi:hypothetical protein
VVARKNRINKARSRLYALWHDHHRVDAAYFSPNLRKAPHARIDRVGIHAVRDSLRKEHDERWPK